MTDRAANGGHAADPPARLLTLSPEELAGDLPAVCARTGVADAQLTPVWFARSPLWAWLPLGGLVAWAAVAMTWAPLHSWWAAGALLAPLLTSQGVTGRVPMSTQLRLRRANLRRRRLGTMLAALLLTWVSVALWLIGSPAAGVLVLTLVIGLYLMAAGMVVAGRMLMVGGWPEPDGGVTLSRVHPDFATAVELHRTGHRP